MIVSEFCFFWGQMISFQDKASSTHLILDILVNQKLHLDRSFNFSQISEITKISETFEYDFWK